MTIIFYQTNFTDDIVTNSMSSRRLSEWTTSGQVHDTRSIDWISLTLLARCDEVQLDEFKLGAFRQFRIYNVISHGERAQAHNRTNKKTTV